MTKNVIDHWSMGNWQRLTLKYVKINKIDEEKTKDSNLIEVKRAPEPTDINWEYVHFHTCVKIKNRAISLLIITILLCISFFVIYFLAASWVVIV